MIDTIMGFMLPNLDFIRLKVLILTGSARPTTGNPNRN